MARPRARIVEVDDGTAVITDPADVGASAATGSHFQTNYGKTSMKAYPITEEGMTLLTKTGAEAALYFTLAGAAFGFAANTHISLTFTQGLPIDVQQTWQILRNVALVAVPFFFLLGLYKSYVSHAKIEEIKANTKFEGEAPYIAKKWPRVVALTVFGAACLVAGYVLHSVGARFF